MALLPGMSDIKAFIGLGRDINKTKRKDTQETEEGVVSEFLPELKLEMTDDQLTGLSDKWERVWNDSPVKAEFTKLGEEAEKYWLGKHYGKLEANNSRPITDNAMFEALETVLPLMTRRNPDPLVKLAAGEAKSPENEAYITQTKEYLADLADELKLRLKIKKVARHWSIYLLGAAKYGWDLVNDQPTIRVIRPQKLILDPDAPTDEDGYQGDRVGEYRKMTAARLIAMLDPATNEVEEKTEYIKRLAKQELGTELQFIEWWTSEYMFWKLGEKVLLKRKNPHWNYDQLGQPTETFNEVGEPMELPAETTPGINHFKQPKIPYSFLSIFNLGKQPVDNTSLLVQNFANQDMINKRNKQIDKNADRMNGGMVVSLAKAGLTKEQAATVSEALRNGGVVAIPDGSPREAIDSYNPQGLPADVYNDLNDKRTRLRDIFGTRGTSAAGVSSEQTVRGKVLSRNLDTDRIGGGITEYLEQFADDAYNWFIQLRYVYDEALIGIPRPKIVISVLEGSLLPKDSTTIANQAIELASAGKMALVDMYKRLEYPNPEELAANVWLEMNAPELLYKDNPLIQQVVAMRQEAAVAAATAQAGGGAPPSGESPPQPAPAEVTGGQELLNQVPTQ